MSEPIVLYALRASHPCETVEAGLRLKRLPYERIDLTFGIAPWQQIARFGQRTVPALRVGRQRVVGSRLILRTLEGLAPDPPLLPADPQQRKVVDEAEEWGDLVLQEEVRWIAVHGVSLRPDVAESFGGDSLPPIPGPVSEPFTKFFFGAEMRVLGHPPSRVIEQYLPALPARLDYVDGLIEQGVIGGKQPNVADLQIAASVRLLLNLEDLRGPIDARPCGELARRLMPDFPGSLPAGTLPAVLG